jgi:hypothetical protein
MKGKWTWFSGALLSAVIVFGMVTPGLRAWPSPAAGEFKLPFNAKWGRVALQMGDYTYSVDSFSSQGIVSVYRGTEFVGTMPVEFFDENVSVKGNRFELLCIRHDGKVTVRALRTNVGTLYFSLPKELKMLLAQQPQLIQTVSVEAKGA